MVHRHGAPRRAGGLRPGPGLHGHPPLRLRALGADPAGPRRHDQAHRAREHVLPAAHPRVLPAQGGRARRGVRPRGGVGDPGGTEGAGGAAGDPAHLRDDHLLDVRGLDPQLPRPPGADQPVGQCGALGDAHAALPAHLGIPLAGGAHLPRDRRRGGGRGRHHARLLSGAGRGVARHAGDPGAKDRVREVRRCGVHPLHRGDDERPSTPPGGSPPGSSAA